MRLSSSAWHHQSKLGYSYWPRNRKRDLGASPTATASRSYKHALVIQRCRQARKTACRSGSLASAADHRQETFQGPAILDRLLACTVYAMPVFEGVTRCGLTGFCPCLRAVCTRNIGLYRLAIVCVRITQYHILDGLIWTDMQTSAIDPGSNMVSHCKVSCTQCGWCRFRSTCLLTCLPGSTADSDASLPRSVHRASHDGQNTAALGTWSPVSHRQAQSSQDAVDLSLDATSILSTLSKQWSWTAELHPMFCYSEWCESVTGKMLLLPAVQQGPVVSINVTPANCVTLASIAYLWLVSSSAAVVHSQQMSALAHPSHATTSTPSSWFRYERQMSPQRQHVHPYLAMNQHYCTMCRL